MLIQGIVGQPSAYPDSSTPVIARVGDMGELMVSGLHGDHFEQTYRRNVFNSANQTGTVTTVGLATTYTGLILSNPLSSTVNLAINKVGVSFLVAFPASAAIGLMSGYSSTTNVTHTTPSAILCSSIGSGSVSQARVDVAATMPVAPVVHSIIGAGLTGAITTAPTSTIQIVDYAGSIVIPPGGYVAIYTSTVSGAASMFASFEWEEVPF